MKINYFQKLETFNEFMKEMESYNFRYKTKSLSLNLKQRKKKIYNLNLATNFKPKINENKIKRTNSSFSFPFFKEKKSRDINYNINYNYNNIYIYKYKKQCNMDKIVEKIKSVKDREKYLVRGLSMTNQEKKYFEKCLKCNTNNINTFSEKEKINDNINTKKKSNIKKGKTLNIYYSLNNFINNKFPLILK